MSFFFSVAVVSVSGQLFQIFFVFIRAAGGTQPLMSCRRFGFEEQMGLKKNTSNKINADKKESFCEMIFGRIIFCNSFFFRAEAKAKQARWQKTAMFRMRSRKSSPSGWSWGGLQTIQLLKQMSNYSWKIILNLLRHENK